MALREQKEITKRKIEMFFIKSNGLALSDHEKLTITTDSIVDPSHYTGGCICDEKVNNSLRLL